MDEIINDDDIKETSQDMELTLNQLFLQAQ